MDFKIQPGMTDVTELIVYFHEDVRQSIDQDYLFDEPKTLRWTNLKNSLRN